MAQGRAGYEWGKYRASQDKWARRNERKKKVESGIYLFKNREQSDYVVKIGMTTRSRLMRLDELNAQGSIYEGLHFWPIKETLAARAKAAGIRKLREQYGSPVNGRDEFQVDTIENTMELLNREMQRFQYVEK